jgi:hypothetical protein
LAKKKKRMEIKKKKRGTMEGRYLASFPFKNFRLQQTDKAEIVCRLFVRPETQQLITGLALHV